MHVMCFGVIVLFNLFQGAIMTRTRSNTKKKTIKAAAKKPRTGFQVQLGDNGNAKILQITYTGKTPKNTVNSLATARNKVLLVAKAGFRKTVATIRKIKPVVA